MKGDLSMNMLLLLEAVTAICADSHVMPRDF